MESLELVENLTPRGARELMKIVIVGHVDHGKSTLIGRLLYDTGSLPPGKFEQIQAVSSRRGMAIEWSFLLDALQAERDQAVTIDSTQIWFKSPRRDYVIIDAPGHREFLRNMVSGAAQADAAVLVIDAAEGVREQTRRHGYLLHLLGVRQIAVAVNKMDLVGFSEDRFVEVKREILAYLNEIGVVPSMVLPLSAREGINLTEPSERLHWFDGPTVLEALDDFHPISQPTQQALRMPLQDVYHFDDRRIFAGRIESGILRVGDRILFSPSNRRAIVRSIEAWNVPTQQVEARAGQSVGITLDEQVFVERGEVISHEAAAPKLTTVFRASVFWLGERPLVPGATYKLKLATLEAHVAVEQIIRIIDTETLGGREGDAVERNAVAEVILRSREMLALDEYRDLANTGRFVLVDDYETVAGGVVSMEGYADQRLMMAGRVDNIFEVDHKVSLASRHQRNGHTGAVVWFTGLSGAGKSTVAMAVERTLFLKGYQVYVLDGDNVRAGLNAHLGFSPEDRAENIRRVGEVAALFADAGFICLTAFISPYQSDRARARQAAKSAFHEIYIKASLEACEQRDPKGLYRRARAGEIQDFTGVSAPYEPPIAPELEVETDRLSIEASVDQVVQYIESRLSLRGRRQEIA